MRSTRILISKSNINHNITRIKHLAPNSKIMAIVKANAYGHGLETALIMEQLGIDYFGVAFPSEAAQLRLIGLKKPILVLVTPQIEEIDTVIEYDLEIIANSLEIIQEINRKAIVAGKIINAHLFINTGMNRDGIKAHEAMELMKNISILSQIKIIGVCTHFATSEEADKSFSRQQLKLFNETMNLLNELGWSFNYIHAANSAAVINLPESQFNLIRPGIALYGIDTSESPEVDIDLRPILSLESSIIRIIEILPGESVGYGRKFIAAKKTKIAIVPIGYGDGFAYRLTGNAIGLIKGKKYPFVGSICMDQSMIDIGNDDVGICEKVTLIGNQGQESIEVRDLASKLNTIPYEILTSLQDRIPRIIVEK